MKTLILSLIFAAALSAQGTFFSTNYTASAGTVATPTLDNDTGSYSGTVTVTFSDATSGATIHTCTNVGSDCTPSSSTTNPVTTTTTGTHICATASKSGWTGSAAKCATYTITTASYTADFNSGATAQAVSAWSANWSDSLSLMWILSGANAANSYANTPALSYYSGALFGADQYSVSTFVSGSAPYGDVGSAVRVTASGNGYAARLKNKTGAPYDCCYIVVYRYDAGTPASLLAETSIGTITLTTGDSLRLDVSGSATVSLRVRVTRTTLGDLYDNTVTDSSGSRKLTGSPGISGAASDVTYFKIDSWQGSN